MIFLKRNGFVTAQHDQGLNYFLEFVSSNERRIIVFRLTARKVPFQTTLLHFFTYTVSYLPMNVSAFLGITLFECRFKEFKPKHTAVNKHVFVKINCIANTIFMLRKQTSTNIKGRLINN